MAVAKRIDMAAWQSNYVAGTSRAGAKLVEKFNSRTGIVDAALDPAAVALFVAKVASPEALAKRAFKLRKQGDAGLHAAMSATGSAAYTAATRAKASKAASGFQPFAPILEGLTAGLPARTQDPATNVANRVTPIAVGLANAKKQIYGSG